MFSKQLIFLRRLNPTSYKLNRFSSEAVTQTLSESDGSQSSTNVTVVRKRHNLDKAKKDKPSKVNIFPAVDMVKSSAWASFDETVDIAVNLGVDPRKPNQAIKGIASLPSGTGKKIRIAVFASGAEAKAAEDAGATLVGAEDLIAKIQGGDISFDRAIATPEMMPLVTKIGRILGPKGIHIHLHLISNSLIRLYIHPASLLSSYSYIVYDLYPSDFSCLIVYLCNFVLV